MRSDEKIFPKVLIIGNIFDSVSGTGITLNNLFGDWPDDKIAIVSDKFADYHSKIVCKVYNLGKEESNYFFPLKYLINMPDSGEFNLIEFLQESKKKITSNEILKNKLWRNLYSNYIKRFLIYSGLNEIIFRKKSSEKLVKWIKDFNPDVIYTLLGTLDSIRFINELKKVTDAKIAIHIMDDWPKRERMFRNYWLKIIDFEFRQLLKETDCCMSICENMSQEYKKRYNKEFIPFHNTIDLNKWKPYFKNEWTFNDSFRIKYFGKINDDNRNSLLDMCLAVNTLQNDIRNIVFEMYLIDKDLIFERKIKNLKGIKLYPRVNHNDIPSVISKADSLLLPLDFSQKCIQYTKFSMPAKTSEFMISGVPIIVYSAPSSALTKYAEKGKWAQVISERSIKKLIDAIRDLYENEELRKSLGLRARKIAIEDHDEIKVRERFRQVLNFEFINKENKNKNLCVE